MKEKQIKQRKNRMDRADEIAIIDVVPLFDFHLEDWGLFRTLTHTCERKKTTKIINQGNSNRTHVVVCVSSVAYVSYAI